MRSLVAWPVMFLIDSEHSLVVDLAVESFVNEAFWCWHNGPSSGTNLAGEWMVGLMGPTC